MKAAKVKKKTKIKEKSLLVVHLIMPIKYFFWLQFNYLFNQLATMKSLLVKIVTFCYLLVQYLGIAIEVLLKLIVYSWVGYVQLGWQNTSSFWK